MTGQLNLSEINQEEALNLTKFFISSNKNIFLFGQRGTGKTSIAIQAAKECNFKINYINLSVIERPDLAGYPDLHTSGDIVTFKSPSFLPKLKDKTPDSIILFDEIDKVNPEITAPLLEILQFKTINGMRLNVAGCILTGNLPEEKNYSSQINNALLDRGAKYILKFNFEKWLDWAKINNIHELILGFLQTDPNYIQSELNTSLYASPSPRGWVLASDAIFQAQKIKMSDIETITNIVSGFVGTVAGLKFKIWYEHYRQYEPIIIALIEDGILRMEWNNLVPSQRLYFVISACHIVKQKILQSQINKKSNNISLYLNNLCKFLSTNVIEPELQLVGFVNNFDVSFITKYKLYTHKLFFQYFTELNDKFNFKK